MTVTPGRDLEYVAFPGRDTADPLRDLAGVASSVRLVQMDRTEGRTAHRHPHSEEVFYVLAGRGRVWIDGATEPVGPGDTVHIPRGAAHATVPDPGEHMELVCFFPHPDLTANSETTEIIVTDTITEET
jgi:quercetin dioxygenase-like cupin family protein